MSKAKALGEFLKFKRESARLSQHQVGEVIDKSRSGYRAFETGDYSPRIDELWKIAELLDFDLVEVLGKIERGEEVIPGPPDFISCKYGIYKLITNETVLDYVADSDLAVRADVTLFEKEGDSSPTR